MGKFEEDRGIRTQEQNSDLFTDGILVSNPFPLYTESGRPDAECFTASNDKTSEFAKAHEMLL